MKKLLKRLLNNKGLTLVELIVVMFLTSVILAIAMGLLVPVKNLMNSLKSNAHMDTVCATANEYIRGTLQTAEKVSLYKLGDGNAIVDSPVIDTDSNVIAILDINAGTGNPPVYRIFDFGNVQTSAELTSRISNAGDKNAQKEYCAFFDAFYEGSSYAVELYNDGKWIQLTSQCYRLTKDPSNPTEAANQKHILNFKLLNGSISGSGADAEINVDPNVTPEIGGGSGYIIVYTLHDWTT